MKTKKLPALTADQVAAAEQEYRRTMTPENRIVRDDIISPFYFGLRIAGYDIAHTKANSEIFSDCPDCKHPYRNHVTKDGHENWACPFCNTLAEIF